MYLLQYIAYPLLLIGSLALILFACELFTNGVEWAGKKLDLSHGATGSVLAAVGTALPETSIPVLALIAGDQGGTDVAVGAIAGAPFMLATLAFFVTGVAVYHYHHRGKRGKTLELNAGEKAKDLGFFLVIYSVAVLTTFVPFHAVRVLIALGMALSYGVYLWVALRRGGHEGGEMEDLHFSRFFSGKVKKRFIFLQVLVSLGLIAFGAHFFVVAVQHVSDIIGVSTLLLSLIITPIATELPEKMNSVLWIKEGKDSLALGNITGAMVFQSSFPVAIGVAFTPWNLNGPTLASAILALLSATLCYLTLVLKNRIPPQALLMGGFFYAVFIIFMLVG